MNSIAEDEAILTRVGSDFRFGCRSISKFMEKREKKNFCIDDEKSAKNLLFRSFYFEQICDIKIDTITSLKCVVRRPLSVHTECRIPKNLRAYNRMRKIPFVFSPKKSLRPSQSAILPRSFGVDERMRAESEMGDDKQIYA